MHVGLYTKAQCPLTAAIVIRPQSGILSFLHTSWYISAIDVCTSNARGWNGIQSTAAEAPIANAEPRNNRAPCVGSPHLPCFCSSNCVLGTARTAIQRLLQERTIAQKQPISAQLVFPIGPLHPFTRGCYATTELAPHSLFTFCFDRSE